MINYPLNCQWLGPSRVASRGTRHGHRHGPVDRRVAALHVLRRSRARAAGDHLPKALLDLLEPALSRMASAIYIYLYIYIIVYRYIVGIYLSSLVFV